MSVLRPAKIRAEAKELNNDKLQEKTVCVYSSYDLCSI
jgi:hypothetical protein